MATLFDSLLNKQYAEKVDKAFQDKYGEGMRGEDYDRMKKDRDFAQQMMGWIENGVGDLESMDKQTAEKFANYKLIDINDWQKAYDKKELDTQTNDFNTKLDSILSNKYTAETFDPSGASTKRWYDTLSTAEKQAEDTAINKTNEQYNFLNPYMTGSGSQLKATNELIQSIAGDRMSRAIQGAGAEFEKQQSINYEDFLTGRANKIAGLKDYQTQNRGISQYARDMDAADREREYQYNMAKKIAEMYKPKESNSWLSPVLGGIGAAVGSVIPGVGTSLGYSLGSGLGAYMGGGSGGGYSGNPYLSMMSQSPYKTNGQYMNANSGLNIYSNPYQA